MRVEGQLAFNNTAQMLNAALAGFGLAYVPEDLVRPHLAEGRLMRVLDDWCPPLFGLPPLLPEPPPVVGGLCACCRCAALPALVALPVGRVERQRGHECPSALRRLTGDCCDAASTRLALSDGSHFHGRRSLWVRRWGNRPAACG